MKIIQLEELEGNQITHYGSRKASIARIAHLTRLTELNAIIIKPGGLLGYHPAEGPQFFIVIKGRGWVRAENGPRLPIQAGQAAFWMPGEEHESGSDTGMTVLVIEGDTVQFR